MTIGAAVWCAQNDYHRRKGEPLPAPSLSQSGLWCAAVLAAASVVTLRGLAFGRTLRSGDSMLKASAIERLPFTKPVAQRSKPQS